MKNTLRRGTFTRIRESKSNYLGATQFKFKNRYYTAFGNLFITVGRFTEEDYQKCCDLKKYELTNMDIDTIKTGSLVAIYPFT